MSIRAFFPALFVVLMLGTGPLHAAPDALIRATLSKPAPHVGETVILELSILVPGWFSGPVTLPATPEVVGAQIRLSENAGANLNEIINGVPYAGVRRHYAITPQQPGRLDIPALPVEVAFADGERQAKTTLQSPAQTLQASIPAGMENLGYIIATPRYRLRQQTDRPLANLRVGDAVVRTIVQSAEGMPAVQLPVLRQPALDGIAAYADDPLFEDRRGEREVPDRSMQTQRITYLLQRPGQYTLPAVELRWFNTRSGKLETAALPALKLRVAAAPEVAVASHDEAALPPPRQATHGPFATDAIHWSWFAGFASALAWLGLRTRRLRQRTFRQSGIRPKDGIAQTPRLG
jgi:hypothetical protein